MWTGVGGARVGLGLWVGRACPSRVVGTLVGGEWMAVLAGVRPGGWVMGTRAGELVSEVVGREPGVG